MKPIWKSKTVWKAVAQGIGGVSIAVLTELEMLGAVVVVSSIVDIILRLITTEAIAGYGDVVE